MRLPALRSFQAISGHRWRRLVAYSLRTQLILAFLTVTALSIAAGVFFNVQANRSRLAEQFSTDLYTDATTEAHVIGDNLSRQVDRITAFSLSKVVQDSVANNNTAYPADQELIQAHLQAQKQAWLNAKDTDHIIQDRLNNAVASELREYQSTFPNQVEMLVTDRYGALAATTDRTTDYIQADKAWWQATWDEGRGATYLGHPSWDERTNSFSMIIAVPLYGHGTREVIGILRTTYQLADLIRGVSNVRWGSTGRAHVILPTGRFLTESSQYQVIDPTILTTLSEAPTETIALDYGGVPSFVSRAPVVDTLRSPAIALLGWSVLVHQNRAESLQPVSATTRATLLTAVIALMLTGVLAFGMAQLIGTPIEQLTRMVHQLASGDLSQRIHMPRNDELGLLAQSFNDMAATINQKTHALHEQITQANAAQAKADAAHAQIAEQLATIEQQHLVIRQMSVPVLPVLPTAMVIPLVGALDSGRMQQIEEQALSAVEQSASRHLILDVTGVPIIDTHVAQGLLRVIQAVRLLGAEVMLVGVRPEVAQALVELGIDMRSVLTRSTLQSGLAHILHAQGRA
jgi:rsbT co-antagonist protein RsbR